MLINSRIANDDLLTVILENKQTILVDQFSASFNFTEFDYQFEFRA